MKTFPSLVAVACLAVLLASCGPKSQPVTQQGQTQATPPPVPSAPVIEKATINGQIFITTKAGENIKLGGVHVHLFTLEEATATAKQVKDDAAASDGNAVAKIDAQTKVVEAEADFPKRQQESANLLGQILARFSATGAAAYISKLPNPEDDSETDADGRFTMQIPKGGSWVIEAAGWRDLPKGRENYFWFFKLNDAAISKGQVFLNNENLASNQDNLFNNVVHVISDEEAYNRAAIVAAHVLQEPTPDKADSKEAQPQSNVPLPDFTHTPKPDPVGKTVLNPPAVPTDANGLPTLPPLSPPTKAPDTSTNQ
jgi:hypothetical protein